MKVENLQKFKEDFAEFHNNNYLLSDNEMLKYIEESFCKYSQQLDYSSNEVGQRIQLNEFSYKVGDFNNFIYFEPVFEVANWERDDDVDDEFYQPTLLKYL